MVINCCAAVLLYERTLGEEKYVLMSIWPLVILSTHARCDLVTLAVPPPKDKWSWKKKRKKKDCDAVHGI
jgi:hypothetical protein